MHFYVTFRESPKSVIRFQGSLQKIPVVFQNLVEITGRPPEAETYKGAYTVVPKVTAQMLPTAQKMMTEDVTVKEIPFFDVSNTSGGTTVYIGSEV